MSKNKKNNWGEKAQKKGKEAEERFIQAWECSRDNFPDWLQRVVRATKHEDLKEATDAWLVDVTGWRTRVQIKRSKGLIRFHRKKHPNFVGIVVVVSPSDTFEVIRERTLQKAKHYKHPSWMYEA